MFSGKIKLCALEKRLHQMFHCTWDYCIRKINSQFPSLGTDIDKQKIVQVEAFPITFLTGIWIAKKHFSLVLKPII